MSAVGVAAKVNPKAKLESIESVWLIAQLNFHVTFPACVTQQFLSLGAKIAD